MAQIIKHRRGSLESISGATKRAGELLVVTGSSGITADNSGSLLFVGIDGSTATPANKILQGSSTPDLTGASYDTSVNGIPFYNTSVNKLYILNKGGNVEVKATANTDGTGIVSGSAQVRDLLPSGVVSGSSQVDIAQTSGFSTFSGSVKSTNDTQDGKINSLINVTGSYATTGSNTFVADQTINGDLILGSNGQIQIHSNTASSLFGLYDGSAIQGAYFQVFGNNHSSADQRGAAEFVYDTRNSGGEFRVVSYNGTTWVKKFVVNDNGASVTGSLKVTGDISGSTLNGIGNVEAFSQSVDSRLDSVEASLGGGGSIGARVAALETFSASEESKNSTLATYTGSVDNKFSTLGTYTGSIDTKFSTLGTYTGSVDSKFSTLGTYTSSVDSILSNLNSYTQSQQNQNLKFATTGSNIFYGSQTITGSLYITQNLVVQGSSSLQNITASAVDIGTNLVVLNTATPAVRFGGVSVQDSGSTQGVSGSLLWDSYKNHWLYVQPSGSNEGYNSAILIAGPMNTGTIGDEATITSGSIQVALGENHIGDSIITQNAGATKITVAGGLDVTGTISGSINGIGNVALYSASVDSRLDVIEASLGGGGSIGTRVSALESFTSSQESKNSTLATYTGSVDSKFSTLGTYTGSVDNKFTELYSSASNHEGRIDSLEAWSSSLDSGFVTETELTNLSSSLDSRIVSLNSFSSSINTTIKNKLNVEGVVSSSSDTSTIDFSISNGVISAVAIGGIVSGSSQLNNTSVSGFKLTSVEASGSFTGSFKGDGSQLTGLVTALKISGSNGTNDSVDLLTDVLTITGSGIVTSNVTDNKITLSVVDSSASQKGAASFDSDDFSVASGHVSIKSGGVRANNLNADVAGTGISLNGVDNSIEVDYGSTAGTAVEGNTSLTIQGTNNEIQITSGSVTLGAGGTVTIGLPDSVTIATASIQNNLSVGGNVNITGNLYVQGSTTTVDSTTIQLGDNVIELNGSGAANGGLLIKDPTAPNTVSGSLLWDSTNDYWKGGALGSEKQFARLNATPTSGSVQVIGANGLLVDSHISDVGDVTISTDLIINGLTGNSFLYADSSKTITSVVPTNAGDMIQWNGSSFVASNTIDGGTF
jgi:spore maturation protein SpmB